MTGSAMEPPPLLSVRELVMGCRAAKVVFTSAKLELFTALAEDRLDAAALARRLRVPAARLRVVLDALAAVGWLAKQGDSYANTALGRRLLVRDSPEFLGETLARMDALWEMWGGLEAVLRHGRPPRKSAALLAGEACEALRRQQAAELAALASLPPGPRRLLDLSGSSCAFALAFLRRYPDLRVELAAPASVLAAARAAAAGSPCRVRERLVLRRADPARFRPRRSAYEAVLVSQLCHLLPAEDNARLVRRAAEALVPGGRLILHDRMLGPSRTNPVYDALFSAEVALLTGRGRLHSTEDCARWLGEAGLSVVRRLELAGSDLGASQALVAEKPG